MAIRVGVLGARGRMGSEVCKVVEAAADLDLVAQLDAGDDLAEFERAGVHVVVDFTVPEVVLQNLEWVVARGMHAVVGTTGWDDARLDTVRGFLAKQPGVGVMIAPNFAIGAVLMMRFAEMSAPFFETAEIIELHHPDKADAPSGTAGRTAALIGAEEYEVATPEVLRLSKQSGCSGYDCEFVATAEFLGVPLVTADAKVVKAFPQLARLLE